MPRCYMVKKNATKFQEEVRRSERKAPGPESPTEATTAPTSPAYYRNLDVTITTSNGYDYVPQNSQDNSVIRRTPIVSSHDGGIPIFRERSAEETEAAHDLLELSRSLPPLPNPVVVRVSPKYEKFSDEEDSSQVVYYEGSDNFKSDPLEDSDSSRSHIPVSVVVRMPTSESEKGFVRGFSAYRETIDNDRSTSPILSYETFSSERYRDETSQSGLCNTECSISKPGSEPNLKTFTGDSSIIPYEEPTVLNYDQSLSSASTDKCNYTVGYDQGPNPLMIRMSPTSQQVTHMITRPVPTKVISLPDPSVPPHVVQFTHIIPNGSQVVDDRSQSSSVIEQVYAVPLPPQNLVSYTQTTEEMSGTNHTPVIRFQSSTETPTEYPNVPDQVEPSPKPLNSEYHSDAENNNPNSNKNSVFVRKRRAKASFLPNDWKRKKTNPSHVPGNSGKGKYCCTQCGRKYATSSNLSRHKQTHRSLDSQSAKKCMTCGKAYVSMPALAMHLLTHKLSHACGVCGKMFSRPWLLQGHLRSHTGEKPYRCGHCGKAFADRSNLRAHMQTHSFEKNYICLKCKKSFALKSYLSKHLESSCLKESNEIDGKTGRDSPSTDTIDVETWSKDGDVDDPPSIGALEIETDESMEEIVVV